MRTLIIALTPPDLGDGLGAALRNLAEGIFVGTTTEIRSPGRRTSISPLRKGNAYRILREALVNARKHAKARCVSLSLEQDARRRHQLDLPTTVLAPPDLDAGPGHLGISTMRARAEAESGRLEHHQLTGRGDHRDPDPADKCRNPPRQHPDRVTTRHDRRRINARLPSPPGPGGARVRTVLICDDQPELRDVVSQLLTKNPRFTVVGHASDGASCLDRVRATQPDLLILDVNMPGGGPQVARQAKEIQPLVHIVVFSGRQERYGVARCSKQEQTSTSSRPSRIRPLTQALEMAYLHLEETPPNP